MIYQASILYYSSNFKRLLYTSTDGSTGLLGQPLDLTELIEELSNFQIQDNKRYAVLVFIYFKEAIDANNHEILINGYAVESGAAVI